MHRARKSAEKGASHKGRLPPFRSGGLWPILLTLATTAGCCHTGQKPCNDIPPGAIPQPNGTYTCQWIHAEMARAEQDKFVIYQYEWSADNTKLTPLGREHLAAIAQGLPQVPFPVVIEPSCDERVNESRRLAVLEMLANCHAQINPDRVVLGRPEAEGLYGQEAPGVAARMLSNRSSGQGAGSMGSLGGGGTSSTLGGTSTSGGGVSGVGIGVNPY
jgi:uncharacterized membrane protein YgcG